MGFVSTQFALPTVTGKAGQVLPFAITPGRCPVDLKTGIRRAPQGTIRRAVQRGRIQLAPRSPVYLNGTLGALGFKLFNWDAAKGAIEGFLTGGPAGAAGGAAAGAFGGKGKKPPTENTTPPPEAQTSAIGGISTGTLAIVGTAMAFGALVIALARSGR